MAKAARQEEMMMKKTSLRTNVAVEVRQSVTLA